MKMIAGSIILVILFVTTNSICDLNNSTSNFLNNNNTTTTNVLTSNITNVLFNSTNILNSNTTSILTNDLKNTTNYNNNTQQINNNSSISLSTSSESQPPPQQQQQAASELIQAVEAARKVEPNEAPKSDRSQILNMYEQFFFKPRSHEDTIYKAHVREGMIKRLQDLGYKTAFLQRSDFEYRRKPASSYNIISILPGRHRHTKDDKILLVGAHWDSYNQAPGVDDNGSGSVCILEIARLLAANKCSFNHTIMLVWFDYEEQGKYGSEFFVNDYLYPKELDRYGSKFIGAYIMDMILVRDKENNTQTLPVSLRQRLHGFSEELEREKNKGDFLATWSRKKHDEPLENAFKASWQGLGNEERTFKSMRPELPQNRTPNAEERYEWKDFFRSDHASFWFPTLMSNAVFRAQSEQPRISTRASLNAILLTDLGPWRRSYAKCYHSSCDDKHLLTDGNLSFMQQVIDSLTLTLLRIAHGKCEQQTIT